MSTITTKDGIAIDEEGMLSFSAREQVRSMIETVPLERASDAYVRMIGNEARFRMVLVIKDGVAQRPPAN